MRIVRVLVRGWVGGEKRTSGDSKLEWERARQGLMVSVGCWKGSRGFIAATSGKHVSRGSKYLGGGEGGPINIMCDY